jgi:hypothetical protein
LVEKKLNKHKLTPSEQCKSAGLKSLAEVVRATGVSERTIINWSKSRPKLFKIIIAGVLAKKNIGERKMTVDVRVNGVSWKEFPNPGKAAIHLGCGYYDNGEFDFTQVEAAEKILRANSATDEMKAEAQAFLDDEVDDFRLEWVHEDLW